jgi:hypothetical protein
MGRLHRRGNIVSGAAYRCSRRLFPFHPRLSMDEAGGRTSFYDHPGSRYVWFAKPLKGIGAIMKTTQNRFIKWSYQ